MAGETLLVISGDGMPPYAVRGLTETFEPIAVATPRRTVNGGLVNIAPLQFRKFKVTLSCTDQQPPALAGLWPGEIVTIDCASEIAYLTVNGSPVPDRTVVGTRTEGDYTFDRLRLIMMVMGPWQQGFAEWAAQNAWTLECEEL